MEPPRPDPPQSTVALTREDVKTLSSDTRVDILKRLGERRMTVTELAQAQDLSKATVLEHLEKLTAASFIRRLEDEKRVWVYYELADKGRRVVFQTSTRFVLLLSGAGVAAVGGGAAFVAWALSQVGSQAGFDGGDTSSDGVQSPREGEPSSGGAPPPSAPSPSPSEESPNVEFMQDGNAAAWRVLLGFGLVATATVLAWLAVRSRRRALDALAAL